MLVKIVIPDHLWIDSSYHHNSWNTAVKMNIVDHTWPACHQLELTITRLQIKIFRLQVTIFGLQVIVFGF